MVLLSISITGCAHGRDAIISEIELWQINAEEVLLVRKISDTDEEVLPIANNPEMVKFYAISKEELNRVIDEALERQKTLKRKR